MIRNQYKAPAGWESKLKTERWLDRMFLVAWQGRESWELVATVVETNLKMPKHLVLSLIATYIWHQNWGNFCSYGGDVKCR